MTGAAPQRRPIHLRADLNLDTRIDLGDLHMLALEWLMEGSDLLTDIYPGQGDGQVNFHDMAELAMHWGQVAEDMVGIGGGAFMMGEHLQPYIDHEKPVHVVYVNSFFVSKYETTSQQYCDYLNWAQTQGLIEMKNGIVYSLRGEPYFTTFRSSPHSHIDYDGGRFQVRTREGHTMGDHAVGETSWYGAAAYCNWRSQQEGYEACYDPNTWHCDYEQCGYRLPTEAEWEYAARGGHYGPYYDYPWGDNTIDCTRANYQRYETKYRDYDQSDPPGPGESSYQCNPLGLSSSPYTVPVDYYPPNPYGLHDMAGSVWERCNDWYSATYYSVSPWENPRGPETGTTRVIRGGGWCCWAHGLRVAHRDSGALTFMTENGGFRVVRGCAN